jgi:hypothetical protein
VYLDDGISRAFEQGAFADVHVLVDGEHLRVSVDDGSFAAPRMRLVQPHLGKIATSANFVPPASAPMR